jgi:hypothetical protein
MISKRDNLFVKKQNIRISVCNPFTGEKAKRDFMESEVLKTEMLHSALNTFK